MDRLTALNERILAACTEPNADCAITATVPLAPVGGFAHNKVMPPTYATDTKGISSYHIEKRLGVDDKAEEIVILDSIQSSANRMEDAARRAKKLDKIPLADVEVNIKALGRQYSTSEMPHRIFDAALRDSTLNGQSFFESPLGQAVYGQNFAVALRAVYEANPLAVLFGGWCSHVGSSRSLKFPRLVCSEIIAGLVSRTAKTGGRLDPLQIEKDIIDLHHQPKTLGHPWKIPTAEEVAALKKKGKGEEEAEGKPKKDKSKMEVTKPSEIGHGNIPPTINDPTTGNKVGGVSVAWIKDIFSLSITRTFRYSTGNEKEDRLVRASLVCLGLYLYVQKTQMYDLRSGCALRRLNPETTFGFENYDEVDSFTLTPEEARTLFLQSLKPLEGVFKHKTVKCEAKPELEKLIQVSI